MWVFEAQSYVHLAIFAVLLFVKGAALISALLYPAQAFEAAGKLTKIAWCAILGIGFAAQLILMQSSPISIIHLIFTIAALVYFADVRPALAQLVRRR